MPRSRHEHATSEDALAPSGDETPSSTNDHHTPLLIADAPGDGWTAPRAIAYAPPQSVPAPTQNLDDPDLPYWLALNRVKGIGPARFKLLLDAFGSAEAAWHGSIAAWQAAGLDTRTANGLEQQRKRIVPEAEVERLTFSLSSTCTSCRHLHPPTALLPPGASHPPPRRHPHPRKWS